MNGWRYLLKVPATPAGSPSSEVPTLVGWDEKDQLQLECSSQKGVGLFLLELLFHTTATNKAEGEAAAEKLTYPLPPSGDSWGNSPNPSFCEKPAGVIWGRDPENCWGDVSWGWKACSQWTSLPATRGVHGRVTWWGQLVHDQSQPQVVARSTSWGRRCSSAHLKFWAWSPLAETRRGEMAKWQWESFSNRQCRSQSQCYQSRHRSSHHCSESQWHQSSLPQGACSGRYTSPSPSPPHPHPTDEQLNCSLSELHLHPGSGNPG